VGKQKQGKFAMHLLPNGTGCGEAEGLFENNLKYSLLRTDLDEMLWANKELERASGTTTMYLR
jgi:hypothetical protein